MILDSNAISDLFREPPPETLIQLMAGAEVHHLPVMVLGEFRYGARFSRARTLLEAKLDRLIETNIVLHVDETTSRVYADIRAKLRRLGAPIPENDIWIAALGLQYELTVISRDRHLGKVPGLHLETW